MESKQPASSPLSDTSSGFSPINSSSSYDPDIQNVSKTNAFNADTKINGSSSSSSSSSNNSSSVSDDEGFVSGEDGFETASERPVLADLDDETLEEECIEGVENGEPFPGSSDFSTPEVEIPVMKVPGDDDVEKDPKVRVLVGEEVEGDGIVLGKESGSVGGWEGSSSIVGDGYTDSTSVDTKDSGFIGVRDFEGKPEIPLDTIPGDNLNSYLNEERGTVEVSEGSNGAKEVEHSKFDEDVISTTEEEVEEITLKSEEPVEVDKVEALINEKLEAKEDTGVVVDSAIQSAKPNQVTPEAVEPTDSKLVEADSGVAAVGDMDESTKEVSIPVDGIMPLVNGSDQTSHINAAVNSKVNEVDTDFDANAKPIADNNVVSTEPQPTGLQTNNAVATKDESLDMGAVVTDSLTANVGGNVEVNACAENGSATLDMVDNEKKPEMETKLEADCEAKQNEPTVKIANDAVEVVPSEDAVSATGDGIQAVCDTESTVTDPADEAEHKESDHAYVSSQVNVLEEVISGKHHPSDSAESLILNRQMPEAEDEAKDDTDEEGDIEGLISDGETDGMIFGSSEAAKQFIEELEQGSGGGSHSGADSSQDHSQRIDGQIVTDSDEGADTDEEGDGKELFDSAALAALLKAATGAESDGGNITITSQDGTRLFSVERPAGLGSSLRSLRPVSRPNGLNPFSPSNLTSTGESDSNLSEEEKKKLEKLQLIRVKFLRLVQRLGISPDESIAARVLYQLALIAGRQTGQPFSLDAAKRTAMQLEGEGKEDLDFSVDILVLGKSGVGKSATINSIFGEEKALIDAFEPATTTVKEINGTVDGVKIRVFDTPGLKSSVMEQAFNRTVLSSVKKFTKKNPPHIFLYVDRLDAQTRDLNDLPLLRTITNSLGPSIWRSAIVTLTHAASAPPDGPSGSPLSYEVFVTQRSHVVQQSIGQAVGDLRMMNPSLMNPVSLVENHPSCRKSRGQKVLPNGLSWRPQLLLLCYSMKILSEANALSRPQDPFDHRKLFGFRARSPPLPYMLSSMLQSRDYPKLSAEQGGENGDSDIDLEDLSDSDQEGDEDEYDQLPPFKPLRKSQFAKLSKEQRKAYFEEYDYRVKLLQKKQWREELKRMREMKKKGKDAATDYGYMDEDADSGVAAPVAVPLPDMVLPPSFDANNPAYRYRFLEPTSQFLARPVLDTHGWDHDCGYDGVNLEHSLAIASRFPAAISVQITKDKKDFSINLDSSVSVKHGEKGSSMAGFDIQNIGKQLAYIIRGETKFKNLKKNMTAAGISITFLGENVATGFKVEDQIVLGKQYVLVGSAGTVRSQQDAAYGANFELQRRELDYPIGQVQSTFGLSVIKWRGDLALGFNSLAQFSIGRSSKVAVRAGINNKLSGQITVRTSSSEHLSLALAAIIPTAIGIYNKVFPSVGEKYSIY